MTNVTADVAPPMPLTRLHILAAVVCAFVLGTDLSEIAIGNALAAIFSAAPYHLDSQSLAWLLSAIYIGAIVGAPSLGWVADRRGLRPTIAGALVWLGVISVLTAMNSAVGWLPVLRILAGLSLGALPPLVVAYLSGIAPPGYRGVLIFWSSAISFLAGPATVFAIRKLVVVQPFGVEGWRWPFAVAGVSALILSFLFPHLPDSRPASSPEVRRQAPTRPALPTAHSVGSRGRFALLGSLYFLQPWASLGFSIMLGPILIQRGYNLTNTLFYVGMTLFGPSVTTFVAGAVIDRFERKYALMADCGLMLLACLLFFASSSPASLLGAVTLFGIAVGFYLPLMQTFAAEIFPEAVRGRAMSGAWALNRIAAFLVPLALLRLLQHIGAVAVTVAICTSLVLSVLVLLVLRSPDSLGRGLA